MKEITFTFDLTKVDQLRTPVTKADTIPICSKCEVKMEINKGAEKRLKTNQINRQYKCPKCGKSKQVKTKIWNEPNEIVIPDYGNVITNMFEKVYVEFDKKYKAEIAKRTFEQPPLRLIDIIQINASPAVYQTNSYEGIDISHLLDLALNDVLSDSHMYALLRTFFFTAIGQKGTEKSPKAVTKVKVLNSKGDIEIMEYPKPDKKVSRNTKTGQK